MYKILSARDQYYLHNEKPGFAIFLEFYPVIVYPALRFFFNFTRLLFTRLFAIS